MPIKVRINYLKDNGIAYETHLWLCSGLWIVQYDEKKYLHFNQKKKHFAWINIEFLEAANWKNHLRRLTNKNINNIEDNF